MMIDISLPLASPPTYECLYEESHRQQIDPILLLAVMRTESGKPGQFVSNRNATFDLGPMQINTIWVPKIASLTNMSEEFVQKSLINHGCSNLAAGAWILRTAINNAKGNIWLGVGLYHSKNSAKSGKYIQKVYDNYLRIQKMNVVVSSQ